MKLLASGCSLIFGSELEGGIADRENSPSNLTYPALLAQHTNLEYKCVATPGNGNDAIARSIVANLDDTVGLVVVNWSYRERWEFNFSDWGWQNFRSHSKHPELENRRHALRKYFIAEATPKYTYYKSLHEIVFLQNYLKTRNIPYIFSAADYDDINRSVIETLDNEQINLLNSIDFEHWFIWEHNSELCGFLRWAERSQLPCGQHGHPLEEAHRKTFEIIKHKVNL